MAKVARVVKRSELVTAYERLTKTTDRFLDVFYAFTDDGNVTLAKLQATAYQMEAAWGRVVELQEKD